MLDSRVRYKVEKTCWVFFWSRASDTVLIITQEYCSMVYNNELSEETEKQQNVNYAIYIPDP